jgi:DNA-binding Xre family transcriptional regulator
VPWNIETTADFDQWFNDLSTKEQKRVVAGVEALRREGPRLTRPLVDTLKGSKHPNMKELRRGSIRILFAFDPERSAVLLVGGDKRGQLAAVVQNGNSASGQDVRRTFGAASRKEEKEEVGATSMPKTYAERAEELLSDPQHRADIERETNAILVANRLAELRQELGISQKALARQLGITQPRVSDLERAENIELLTLQRYVEALGGQLDVRVVLNGESVGLSPATPEVVA